MWSEFSKKAYSNFRARLPTPRGNFGPPPFAGRGFPRNIDAGERFAESRSMSHRNDEGSAPRPLRDKRGLVNRVRRLRGQVDAIERALGGEASCSDLLQRITAARGAINGLMAEVLEEHVREYLSPADSDADPRQADAAEELIEIIHSYLT
jgi:DNA-binding FrmR family transcriptional regulator